ncbi:MAG: type II toxin-antitoxin system HicB family antitoxin [Hyphomicrobiales bacterium]|nr:type II toxin-antitoxin system HicB family antitoxin [Hyphomicrobiales bacterium]
MTKVYYPAVIDKDADSDFGVHFPGCVTAGVTIEEAILNAHEALSGHTDMMAADGDALPEPSSLQDVIPQNDASTVAVTLAPIIQHGKVKRVNVTLDEGLLSEIDTISNNRSGFLAQAARAEIARRKAS